MGRPASGGRLSRGGNRPAMRLCQDACEDCAGKFNKSVIARLDPKSGLPDFGTSKWSKSETSDFDAIQ
jgi:hypothetical protein